MAKVKEKKIKEPVNWKKELKLAPAYLILFAWVAFTVVIKDALTPAHTISLPDSS